MPFFGKFGKPFTTGTGPPPTDDLTVPTRDELFEYQMMQDNPSALSPESLYIAKICETHQYATSVFKSSQKAHVITAAGLPDTSRIDSSLVSQIAIISVPKTRELVNLLFFWEEEVTRLRLLDEEVREIEGLMREREGGEGGEGKGGRGDGVEGGNNGVEELCMALKAVQAKRGVVPSRRKRDGTVVGESRAEAWAGNGEEALPAYE